MPTDHKSSLHANETRRRSEKFHRFDLSLLIIFIFHCDRFIGLCIDQSDCSSIFHFTIRLWTQKRRRNYDRYRHVQSSIASRWRNQTKRNAFDFWWDTDRSSQRFTVRRSRFFIGSAVSIHVRSVTKRNDRRKRRSFSTRLYRVRARAGQRRDSGKSDHLAISRHRSVQIRIRAWTSRWSLSVRLRQHPRNVHQQETHRTENLRSNHNRSSDQIRSIDSTVHRSRWFDDRRRQQHEWNRWRCDARTNETISRQTSQSVGSGASETRDDGERIDRRCRRNGLGNGTRRRRNGDQRSDWSSRSSSRSSGDRWATAKAGRRRRGSEEKSGSQRLEEPNGIQKSEKRSKCAERNHVASEWRRTSSFKNHLRRFRSTAKRRIRTSRERRKNRSIWKIRNAPWRPFSNAKGPNSFTMSKIISSVRFVAQSNYRSPTNWVDLFKRNAKKNIANEKKSFTSVFWKRVDCWTNTAFYATERPLRVCRCHAFNRSNGKCWKRTISTRRTKTRSTIERVSWRRNGWNVWNGRDTPIRSKTSKRSIRWKTNWNVCTKNRSIWRKNFVWPKKWKKTRRKTLKRPTKKSMKSIFTFDSWNKEKKWTWRRSGNGRSVCWRWKMTNGNGPNCCECANRGNSISPNGKKNFETTPKNDWRRRKSSCHLRLRLRDPSPLPNKKKNQQQRLNQHPSRRNRRWLRPPPPAPRPAPKARPAPPPVTRKPSRRDSKKDQLDDSEHYSEENFAEWMPPDDQQTGDGRTALNDKYGY